MKSLKQLILGAGILAGGLMSAQSSDMTNMLKVGLNTGISTGGNTAANVGVDLSYQNLITPGFGLGIATGYNQYFGKNRTINGVNVENNDFGVIPVAALFRVYPKQTGFYFGADLGYGFIVGDDKVASNVNVDRPDGGFYIRPEIGYHNRDWNFFAQYNKTFTGDKGQIGDQKYNAGAIGVGVAYNIPLGK
ncbi:hypothetical protein [Epilithonimonas hispanica]|uniref:Outer membrane protein beta-barrel domain-containing protein n=1 Tax=Epilithonimonas hispanica TaxID=358687 RepID=A0A3D9CVN1_9FLAO|nr:hypothetical protein [Epilithonimonas hispanica]REC69843.1 hypothetical protein DRF58_11740 [Epilithonimonas hispanica]